MILMNHFIIHIFIIALSLSWNELGCTIVAFAPNLYSLRTSNQHKTFSKMKSSKIESFTDENCKTKLLSLLEQIKPNQSTQKYVTDEILTTVKRLEMNCPTKEEDVLVELGGNWELIWTAQDGSSLEMKNNRLRSWINPLENQSYSNKPIGNVEYSGESAGRANPILPQNIQNKLEDIGILAKDDGSSTTETRTNNDDNMIKSSQAIDLKRGRVRNVVSVLVNVPSLLPPLLPFQKKSKGNNTVRGSLTVDVSFTPNNVDSRKIDVKFDSCRVTVPKSPLDLTFPLGPIGPTGWLRTGYIDDSIRITRGHKGSVFILKRTSKRS